MSETLPAGATCEHLKMRECCEGCGHWHCDDCGLSFDEGCDFPMETDAERQTELAEQLAQAGRTD